MVNSTYGHQPLKQNEHLKDSNDEQTFEDMLRSIGGFGWGSFRIYCLISLTDIFSSFSTISVVFIGATPNWSCTSFDHAHNRTVELPEGRCEANGTVSCENYHYGDDFTSIVTEWHLLCDKDYVSDLLTTVQMCGMAFGAFIFSQMSDVLRRKYSFYGAYCIQVTFALASAFSTSWQMYMVFRILVGVGFGGTMVVNIVYPLEFVTSRWRVLCLAMGFWPIGALIVPFVAYLVPDWKMLTIITSALGFLYAFTWPWLPESPRWLMQKGYYSEASDILCELSKQNGRPGSGPSPEKLEKILQNERKSEQKSDKKRYTFIDLVKNTHYLKQTAILAFTWFMSFLMYYFITFNMKNLSGNRYLNMVYAALADVLSQFIVMTTLNKSGRRFNLLASMGTALLCMVGILCLLMTGHEDSVYIMILCLVGKTATSTVTFVAGIYTAEVFPTAIRNIGVGVCSVMSRFGTLLAPMLAYLGLKFVLAPYIICGVLTMVSTPLLFMLPETTGVSLRDTIPTSHKKPDGTKETEEDSLTIDNVEAQSLEMKNCIKL